MGYESRIQLNSDIVLIGGAHNAPCMADPNNLAENIKMCTWTG
jgi:hypothetical protein